MRHMAVFLGLRLSSGAVWHSESRCAEDAFSDSYIGLFYPLMLLLSKYGPC